MNETTVRPQAHATTNGNLAVLSLPDGGEERITFGYGEDIRMQIVSLAIAEAQASGAPIELVTTGQHLGDMRLAIHPDGRVKPALADDAWDEPDSVASPDDLEDEAASIAAEAELLANDPTANLEGEDEGEPAVEVENEPVGETAPADEQLVVTPVIDTGVFATALEMNSTAPRRSPRVTEVPAVESMEEEREPVPQLRRRSGSTFIDTREPLRVEPTSGWRRVLSAVGIKVAAARADLEHEQARRAVSAQWGQCRRIAVVNGKGGVGKTSTTAMLAAVFGREGGGGVLAWDNNPTRGSLGWRTESAGHDATVQDLLEHANRLLDPNAPRALVADFVHHQTDDRYDVLRSNPQLLAIRQQIDVDEFDLLSRVVDRSYRLTVFDSGNDESASRWLRMVDWSHQLVIPTLPSPESAESAMLLLQELSDRDEHSRDLAEHAVVVVMRNEPNPGKQIAEIKAGFDEVGVQVFEVPFDKAMKSGPLRYGTLAPETQEAWLQVAAAASAGFTRTA